MPERSYSEIEEQIAQHILDVDSPEARAALVRHLTQLTFELDRLKQTQKTILAAIRARDILVHEDGRTEIVVPAGTIDLDPRDALDASENLHDIEWAGTVAFRWTGPGHTTVVRAWVDRTLPIVFELKLHDHGDDRNRGQVGLTVDGFPVAFRDAGEGTLRSDPFPLVAASLLTEVGIHVPWLLNGDAADAVPSGKSRTRRGKGASPAADTRVRGIAIARMRFCAPT
jgi:hypothetical protein